jgi:hypothetical protein
MHMDSKEVQLNTEHTVIIQDEGLRKLKGFVQIPKVVLLSKKLSYGAKVVYGILLNYAWQDDFCFPAQKFIAKDLDCSIRQAQRFLDELKQTEFITWKQMGLNRPNVYYILSIPKEAYSSEPEREKQHAVSERKNKDATHMSHPDMTHMAYPDTTDLSPQGTTDLSYKVYPITNKQNNVNVNGDQKKGEQIGTDEESALSDVQKTPHQTWPESPPQIWRGDPPRNKQTKINNLNHVNVNADKEEGSGDRAEAPKTDLRKLPDLDQDKASIELIAKDILRQLGDRKSFAFYYLVASKVPEQDIYTVLSNIKQSGAKFPPKVFSTRMKEYAAKKMDTRSLSLQAAIQDMRTNMTLR